MIKHIVMFKLKEPVSENANEVALRLKSMEGKIPFLKHIEVGIDVIHSERSCDIVLITHFDSLEDLKNYQEHPIHVEVADYILTVREYSKAVDFEVN